MLRYTLPFIFTYIDKPNYISRHALPFIFTYIDEAREIVVVVLLQLHVHCCQTEQVIVPRLGCVQRRLLVLFARLREERYMRYMCVSESNAKVPVIDSALCGRESMHAWQVVRVRVRACTLPILK